MGGPLRTQKRAIEATPQRRRASDFAKGSGRKRKRLDEASAVSRVVEGTREGDSQSATKRPKQKRKPRGREGAGDTDADDELPSEVLEELRTLASRSTEVSSRRKGGKSARQNGGTDDPDAADLMEALRAAAEADNLYESEDDDDDADVDAGNEYDDDSNGDSDGEEDSDQGDSAMEPSDEDEEGNQEEDSVADDDDERETDEGPSRTKGDTGKTRIKSSRAASKPRERNRREALDTNEPGEGGSEDDSDEDFDDPIMHKEDLEELKKTDPSFYQYLQENDRDLLKFGDADDLERVEEDADGDGSSGEEEEENKSEASEGDSAAEEAAAAEEAGLDGDISDDDDDVDAKHRKSREPKLVDMAYIRMLKEELSTRKTRLSAVKELMRLLRAGRHLTESSIAKAPTKRDLTKPGARRKKGKAADDEDEQVEEWLTGKLGEDDDASDEDEEDSGGSDAGADDEDAEEAGFEAGEYKFATTRVYQKLMHMAIVNVQGSLDAMLGRPMRADSALAARWTPTEHKRWKNLEPIVKSFVAQMISLVTTMKDATTLRFLLKRLELLVPYTRGNRQLGRRLTKLAVSVWKSETLSVDEATKLRAYLLLRAIADEPDNVESVLRLTVFSFCGSIAKVCNPRTLPNIMFSAKCIVDLFGVDMAASYTVAFTYLREMAVSLRAVLVAKQDSKESANRIHNWSFVNGLRLWSMVLSTYSEENELRPLIYPFVQIAIGVMRVQPTPRTYPMRLHICAYLVDVVAGSGVYIPVAAHLLPLLRCKELRRLPARGVTKDLEWRSLLRVSDDTVKTKPFLSGVVNGVVLHLSGFYAAFSRHVSFPEVSHAVASGLRRFAKETKVEEWRSVTLTLASKLVENGDVVAKARAKAEFGPRGAIGAKRMLEAVPGLEDAERRTPVQRFYDVEAARVKKREQLRDEGLAQKRGLERTNGDAGRHGDAAAGEGEEVEDAGSSIGESDSDESDGRDRKGGATTRARATGRARAGVVRGANGHGAKGASGARHGARGGDDSGDDEIEALALSSDDDDGGALA